jgi:hypothetical protein
MFHTSMTSMKLSNFSLATINSNLYQMPGPEAFTNITLDGLNLLSRGKVRDVYETSDPTALLFVASDRISAYDVVLNNVCAFSNPP